MIGSACVKLFVEKGWEVIAVDNNMRGTIFGKDADTKITIQEDDVFQNQKVQVIESDIRDQEVMKKIIIGDGEN